MRVIPTLCRRPIQYDGLGTIAECGQPILQFKEPGIDWARYKAWLNALHEPYDQWLARTRADDPEHRQW